MNFKIVSDSSSNIFHLEGAAYTTVPMKVVAHCFGEQNALELKAAVMAKWPQCRFEIEHTTALCSFYAEAGGLMIGFEGDYNTNNNNKDF